MRVSTVHLLHLLSAKADKSFEAHLDAVDVTPRQYEVLAAVARQSQQSQTDLIRNTGVDRASMSDIVGRMVAKGWIARRRSKTDKRAYTVALTQKGVETLKNSESAARAATVTVLGAISANDRSTFLRIVQALLDDQR